MLPTALSDLVVGIASSAAAKSAIPFGAEGGAQCWRGFLGGGAFAHVSPRAAITTLESVLENILMCVLAKVMQSGRREVTRKDIDAVLEDLRRAHARNK